MPAPAPAIFSHLTAFLSPLVPPPTRLAWLSHGGNLATHSEVDKDHCHIDLYFADYLARTLDPLVPRLEALGIQLHDSAWITACLASRRLVDHRPFSFPALDLDSSPLAQPDPAPLASAHSPALSHDTPHSVAPSSSRRSTSTHAVPRSRTTTTTTTHDLATPLTTAARSTDFRQPSPPSPESSPAMGAQALSMSDAEVERLLLERAGPTSFLGKLHAARAGHSTDDDNDDVKMYPSPVRSVQHRLSSSESQFADLEDLADGHLTPSSGTPSRHSRSASPTAKNDHGPARAKDDDAPSSLAAFFAQPLIEQGGRPPVYDADALVALLRRQGSAPREQVERVVHGEAGWTVRRRARGGTTDEG
ncbi:hypothetical protein JCM3775_002974 [Rhodotorula graminis]